MGIFKLLGTNERRGNFVRLAVEDLEGRVVPATFTVTSSLDDGGAKTLRSAITAVNDGVIGKGETTPYDRIDFNIAGGGAQTITVKNKPLPDITQAVVIDGTQAGQTITVTPDPALAKAGADGLTFASTMTSSASHSEVDALSLSGFRNGVVLKNVTDIEIGSNLLAGVTVSKSTNAGIFIGAKSSDISIMGSVLGTDSTEAANLGNKYGIQIDEATNVTIGGTSSSELNEISGNTSYGIQLVSAKNTTVIGNYIGTKKDGTTASSPTIPGSTSSRGRMAPPSEASHQWIRMGRSQRPQM